MSKKSSTFAARKIILIMDIPQYIQQLIDNGIAHYDMDGCVVLNAPFNDGGWGMNVPHIHIQNCGNTYNTYNFYGDNATNNDIHENSNPQVHRYER